MHVVTTPTDHSTTLNPGGAIPFDQAPMNLLVTLVAISAFGGIIVDGYILGIIGSAIGPASQELGLPPLGQGLIAASALIGIFISGLFFGRVADRFGRKRVFFWNLIGFVAVSVAQLFVVGTWDLVAMRILLGLLIGVEYAVGTSLLAEFAPRRHRSVLLGSIAMFWFVGFVAAFFVGHFWNPEDWRGLLATSAIPAVITLIIRFAIPESPLWLQSQGRDAEAQAIVRKHYGPQYALVPVKRTHASATLKQFFVENDWRRVLYAGLFWFCQVGPMFAIFTFILPVLDALGLKDNMASDLLMNGLQIAGAVLGLLFLSLVSRRSFVISTFAIMLALLLFLGLAPQQSPLVALSVFGVFVLVITAANNIQYVYPPEMFDTRFRSTGVGFAAAFSRIGAALATYLLPLTLQTLGIAATLLIAAVFPLIGLISSMMWAPETKYSGLK